MISPERARDGTDSIFQRPDTTLKGLIYQHSRGFEGGNIRAMDVGMYQAYWRVVSCLWKVVSGFGRVVSRLGRVVSGFWRVVSGL